jgi:prepilin-type N-terminal cleavage/methylation domain-containing protein
MRSRESRSSRGFSLVEVLIVIAVLAVLMAMLLPAIQSFRASARRTDCGNNLKNLAAGIHGFHSQNGQLPPAWGAYPGFATTTRGANGYTASSSMFGSWIAHILPHIDMNAEYLRLPQAKVCLGYRRWENVPNSRQVGAASIPCELGHQLTRDDGVSFNVHDSTLWFQRSYTGNTVAVADPSKIRQNGSYTDERGRLHKVWTDSEGNVWDEWTDPADPGGPTSTFTFTLVTLFDSKGVAYRVWRPNYSGLGNPRPPKPAQDRKIYLGNRNKVSDNLSWVNVPGNISENKVGVYFNLQKYPAAQETIRVPLTACKGDNSEIESTQRLPWLGNNKWTTTNYMINPFAFHHVENEDFRDNDKNWDGQLRNKREYPPGWGRYRVLKENEKRLDKINDGQSSTILLVEGMRNSYSFVTAMQGTGELTVPKTIQVARLAFWSSPKLINTVDMWIPTNFTPWSYSKRYDLAIEPHPLSVGGFYDPVFMTPSSDNSGSRVALPVPAEVSWKPWTHNFGIEWEALGQVDVMFANTFMFQTQPRPEEASSIRAQSNHGSVLMVAMCDGSVRAIRDSISHRESDPILPQSPNMGNRADPDGTWDRLMRDNDGSLLNTSDF